MPRISDEFYEQGLALYRSGGTIRQLTDQQEAIRTTEETEHHNAEMGGGDPEPRHRAISDRYRFAEHSLSTGFADGVLADLRVAVAQRRGQRA